MVKCGPYADMHRNGIETSGRDMKRERFYHGVYALQRPAVLSVMDTRSL